MARRAEISIINNQTGHKGFLQRTADQDLINEILRLLRIDSLVSGYHAVTITIQGDVDG